MRVNPLYVSSSQNPDAAEGGFLVGAVDMGDLEKLKLLLQLSHVKSSVGSEMGWAAFVRATCLNRVDMMELLFPKNELKINDRNKAGETAVMQAARHNSPEALVWLMEMGADVNIMDNSGSTPFLEYVKSLEPSEEPSEKILDLFLEVHLDLVAADAGGRTPLMLLAQRPGTAKYLLLERTLAMMTVTPKNSIDSESVVEARSSLNAIDENGCTALHIAIECRDHKFAKMLVQAGVLISTVANDGRSALDAARDAASDESDRAFVKYLQAAETLQKNQALIQAGEQRKKVLEQHRLASTADDSAADSDDDSWGGMALNSMVSQKVFWKLRFETDFSEMSHIKTPLLGAVLARDREYVRYILKNESPNIDVRGPGGWTPLMHAAAGEADFLRFLLAELDKYGVKVDLNVVNDFNQSALVVAASNGSAENMKILLGRDAGTRPDVNIIDKNGANALMVYLVSCREELDAELVGLLLDEGLNVAWQSIMRQTATMMFSGTKGSAAKERFLQAPGVRATLDMLDENNLAAVMYAVLIKDFDYLKLLVDAGADVHLQSEGNSARKLAQESGLARFLELIDSVPARAAGDAQAGRPVARMTDSD